MSNLKLHYDDWDGGTEADTDPPDQLMCGTECGDPQMTQDRDKVTCKRCINIMKFFGWKPKP